MFAVAVHRLIRPVRSVRIQSEAVTAIQNAGGTAFYDWEWRDGKYAPEAEPWGPARLANLGGVDYLGYVRVVGSYGFMTATDRTFEQIGR
jgi:hypothetical protein